MCERGEGGSVQQVGIWSNSDKQMADTNAEWCAGQVQRGAVGRQAAFYQPCRGSVAVPRRYARNRAQNTAVWNCKHLGRGPSGTVCTSNPISNLQHRLVKLCLGLKLHVLPKLQSQCPLTQKSGLISSGVNMCKSTGPFESCNGDKDTSAVSRLCKRLLMSMSALDSGLCRDSSSPILGALVNTINPLEHPRVINTMKRPGNMRHWLYPQVQYDVCFLRLALVSA